MASSISLKKITPVFALWICSIISQHVMANGFGPLPVPLSALQVPPVPGLVDGPDPIIINKEKAIILGKALFWDINTGSDGMACASCHFHAGADSRIKNQIAPGGKSTPDSQLQFDIASANHRLTAEDFPYHQRTDPLSSTSEVIKDSDDVSSSSGSFTGQYRSSHRFRKTADNCKRTVDADFNVNSVGVRQVQYRNTPTVYNAVFNHRNFWDGRANNVFNGSSPWGDRDADAGIWVKVNGRQVVKQRLHLINSSLASQALAPPLSSTEMSCSGRTFADIGRKLLMRRPLEHQKVHYQDSVLGALSYSTANQQRPGLKTTYARLVRQAFNSKYWSFHRRGPFGRPARGIPYSQMEANFSMFFALAIQLYESTLITDQSPFDISARDADDGVPIDLTPAEQHGMQLFRDNHCSLCHTGPDFTAAAVFANAEAAKPHPEAFSAVSTTHNVVSRTLSTHGPAFFDVGFANTGVTNVANDHGVGDNDPFGHPLSFSKQYLQLLAGYQSEAIDEDVNHIRPCDFDLPFAINFELPFPQSTMFTPKDGIVPQAQTTTDCFYPITAFLPLESVARAELESLDNHKMLHAVDGAFKIPSLRNIELTGPYMHNGSMSSLEQVIEFYTRGGNVDAPAKQSEKVFSLARLKDSAQNRADLIAFLKTLTDNRVRYEQAPFDHPEIKIPEGHIGDEFAVQAGHPLSSKLARDEYKIIEAVGAFGRQTPILPFDELINP